jgi:hypothetical protein
MKYIYFLLFIFSTVTIYGQATLDLKNYPVGDTDKKSDLQLEALQIDNLDKLYYQIIASPKDLINGKECLPYSFRGNTTAYLFTRDKLIANLIVNNRLYKNIKLQYDTFKDDLIFVDTSRIINFEFPRIALNKEIIEGFSFYFSGRFYNFRHLRFSENSDKKLTDGFYEVVYEGQTKLIIKHLSTFYSKEGLSEYKYSPERYIWVGDKYHKIKNRKDLLLLFDDHSKEVKEFLRKEGIKVKKAEKERIVEVLKYYDSLKISGRLPG